MKTKFRSLAAASCFLLTVTSTQAQTITANNDVASVAAGSSVTINVLANDVCIGGTPTLTGFTALTPTTGTLVKNTDNTFTYTAPAGASGTVTFKYVIRTCGISAAPIGHTYQFVSAPGIKWTDAKAAAEEMTDLLGRQGYLATITSEAENILAYAATQYIQPSGQLHGHPVWLGGSDAEEEGVWKWVTGPEEGVQFSTQDLTFTSFVQALLPQMQCGFHKFANYEPNQNNGWEEDYLQLQGQNYWNDMRNELNTADMDGYLVEFGGMEAAESVLIDTGIVTITIPALSGTTVPTTCPTPTITTSTTTTTSSGCGYSTTTTTNNVNELFIGYGPQSMKLKVTALPGYTYSWKRNNTTVSGSTSTTFTPTAAGLYTFTVTAVSSTGCVKTASKTICVKNVRVPNTCGYVYMCYTWTGCGGNTNKQTLYMPTYLVPYYLNAGATLGTCNSSCGLLKTVDDESQFVKVEEFKVNAYPNPTDGVFNLDVPFSLDPVSVTIYDINGRLVDSKEVKSGGERVLNYNLRDKPTGLYIITITDGIQRANGKIFIN